MSHSRVFQLETFQKSEYDKHDVEELNEFSLEQNQFPNPNYIDYWENSENVADDFDWLVKSGLPDGMFEVNKAEQSLTYVKRPDEYIQKYIDKIKAEVDMLSLESFYSNDFSTWYLKRILLNNDNEFMIYSSEDGYPIYIKDWIIGVAKTCEIGKKFYLGGVLSYHY